MSRSPFLVCAAPLALAALAPLSGCVTDQPPGMAVPDETPAGLVPTRMAIFPGYPRDTNANGHLDTIPVRVYLFDTSTDYAFSIAVPGTFHFRLTRPGGTLLGEWTIDEKAAAAAVRTPKPGPGPGYVLSLSLLDLGEDKDAVASGQVDLQGEFRTSGGRVVRTEGASSFLFSAQPSAKARTPN